jgi:hypothetical protein
LKLKEKHTSNFLILIAGLIVFSHAVIPHHHHFDSLELHSKKFECKTAKMDIHNENTDTHCHAFNLIIAKSRNNLTKHTTRIFNFNFYILNYKTNFDLVSKLNEVNYTHCFIFSPYKKIFLTNISLRAPPVAV